jgi:hypothetical protein
LLNSNAEAGLEAVYNAGYKADPEHE